MENLQVTFAHHPYVGLISLLSTGVHDAFPSIIGYSS